ITENVDMLKLSHKLATIERNMSINAALDELQVIDYTTERFVELEQRGFRLIVKHAKSLYSFV
ncbi:5'-3' exonuclease, partial [Butyricicoccus sp. 1XD8-22]